MNKSLIVSLLLTLAIGLALSATMHVDKCDNYCGGSKLNPFGKSGTCKSCCMEKGFTAGGECGDLLYRHCRCTQNPPFYPGAAPYYPPGAYPNPAMG